MGLSIDPHNAPDPSFTFAFQPIVETKARELLSYEALIRGSGNQPAYQILEQVPAERMHLFDEKVRMEAIGLATRLGIGCDLNLNLLPRSLYSSPTPILRRHPKTISHLG
jgi:blue light- and temperature-responsive anti-repressor